MDEDEAQGIYEAASASLEEHPLPPELKERLEVFAEAYALVEEMDITEATILVQMAWPIFREHAEAQRG